MCWHVIYCNWITVYVCMYVCGSSLWQFILVSGHMGKDNASTINKSERGADKVKVEKWKSEKKTKNL